jgi:spermidine synthase
VLLVLIWFWGFLGTNKNSQGQIFETESAYNYIQVLEVDGFHYLRLNEGQGVHSVYHPSQMNYHGPWEQVMVAPFFNPAPVQMTSVKRAAIIGLAAGTTARQLTAVYGAIPIDGFEIDPVIIAVGQKYFGMTEPNLNPIVQDGRWGLAHSSNLYDIISVDAYRPPYIPAHLTTREFFEIVRAHLTPTGVVAINVGRAPADRSLINSLSSTLLTVFSTVQVVDVPDSFNSVVFASSQPISADNLILNRIAMGNDPHTPALLLETMDTAIAGLQPQPPAGQVFTDDKAPIEWITNNMVLRYLISGNVEKQQ